MAAFISILCRSRIPNNTSQNIPNIPCLSKSAESILPGIFSSFHAFLYFSASFSFSLASLTPPRLRSSIFLTFWQDTFHVFGFPNDLILVFRFFFYSYLRFFHSLHFFKNLISRFRYLFYFDWTSYKRIKKIFCEY